MRWWIPSVLTLLLLMFVPASAADKRVALVIGNAAYPQRPPLATPINDATAIAQMLRTAGFEVSLKRDLGAAQLRRAVRDFADDTSEADTIVLFFAGQGIEIDGTTYLIPVDAALKSDADVVREGVPLRLLASAAGAAKRLGLVIIDAGRSNPFAQAPGQTERRADRGPPGVETARSNLLIAYATNAGGSVADGSAPHSPFTRALLDHLATPGLDIRRALGRVRDAVVSTTGAKQLPFVVGRIPGSEPVALVETAPQR